MKNLIAVAILLFPPSLVYAHELVSAFQGEISVSTADGISTVEYCPDNTCEVFVLVGGSGPEILQDFAFAYLFGFSQYNYLQSFRADTQSSATQAVFARYRSYCPSISQTDTARCIFRHLLSKYEISATFVRYDEGKRSIEPIDLGALAPIAQFKSKESGQ
jgi:hypothetical protein